MSKVLLIVGHKEHAGGAVGTVWGEETDEWHINDKVVDDIIARYKGPLKLVKKYRVRYDDLPREVDNEKPMFAIEFHLNAANTVATGSETLYNWESKKSELLAALMQKHVVEALDLRDRGTKRISMDDRGGYLLCNVRSCPIVILEPYFLDNVSDCARFEEKYDEFIKELCEAINEAAGRL